MTSESGREGERVTATNLTTDMRPEYKDKPHERTRDEEEKEIAPKHSTVISVCYLREQPFWPGIRPQLYGQQEANRKEEVVIL